MILDEIVAHNAAGLEASKRNLPLKELQKAVREAPPPRDFAAALQGSGVRLIAEVKKASPSRGIIRADFNPVEIAQTYTTNGAAAISILTEPGYFQGNLRFLKDIRVALGDSGLPLLRKDFITDPYQVYQSRACGADSLLLIVAILSQQKLEELLNLSLDLDMICLVEVHDEMEMATALGSGARIIGINNRDLKTFTVDLATTGRLRPLIPDDRIVVSESGIKNHDDMVQMREWGVDAVLIGESLMATTDIAAKMRELTTG